MDLFIDFLKSKSCNPYLSVVSVHGVFFSIKLDHVGKDEILDMNIADGLKEALVNSGFTRNQILANGTDELASALEIEQYVANLILEAAKHQNNRFVIMTSTSTDIPI